MEVDSICDPRGASDESSGNESELECLMRDFAVAFFIEPVYVQRIAAYLSTKYMNPKVGALDAFDSLITGLLTAPFAMRLYGFRGLEAQSDHNMRYLMILEPFHGVPVALPLQVAFTEGWRGFCAALTNILSHASDVYHNIRRGRIDSEYTFECFSPDASRLLSKFAWPTLLVAFCYLNYVTAFDNAVKDGIVDVVFATDAIRASHRTLNAIVSGSTPVDSLRRGPSERLTLVKRDVLQSQLSRLNDILSGSAIGIVRVSLEKFVAEIASSVSFR